MLTPSESLEKIRSRMLFFPECEQCVGSMTNCDNPKLEKQS